jgi:hypothetical protein
MNIQEIPVTIEVSFPFLKGAVSVMVCHGYLCKRPELWILIVSQKINFFDDFLRVGLVQKLRLVQNPRGIGELAQERQRLTNISAMMERSWIKARNGRCGEIPENGTLVR